jgi:LacI family transcriptional regulator
MVREKHVDGLILIGVCDACFIDNVNRVNLPTVFVDPQNQINNYSQIFIDNEHGAFLATQYLIQSGHHKIGFISGELNRLSFQQRYEGYLKALKFHKIELNENLVRTGGIEQGYFHIKNILQTEKPTAIFAANDINALHGYKAVYDLNLKIPRDISIIGFDDISMAKFAVPPLTTIRVYKEELGSIAVRTLLRTINQRIEKSVTTIVPVELIKRDSVRVLAS